MHGCVVAAGEASLLVPASGGTVLATSGDDFTMGPRSLGFSFSFFGSAWNQVYVNSNGNLTFGSGSTGWVNGALPASGYARIAPFWDDLRVPNGDIREILGTGFYAVIWNGVTVMSSGAPQSVTLEAVLVGAGNPFGLDANTVAISYGAINGANGSATVGLNQGNGVGFATLNALGIGGADGKLTQAQAVGLSNFTFCFTPDAGGTYVAGVCNGPQTLSGNEVLVENPEPSTLVLLGLGAIVLGRLRRRA